MKQDQTDQGKFSNLAVIALGVGLLIFIVIVLYRTSQQPPQEPANVGSLKKMIKDHAKEKEAEERY